MDRTAFIDIIVKHSCIIEYLHIQDQSGPIIDQFMIIYMNCCSSNLPVIDSDQILIDTLCTEGQTKSSFVKILPEFVSDQPGFRQKLLEMSKLTAINSIGIDAKLEIVKESMDKFDPFYWAFSMNLRLKAWSNFKEHRPERHEYLQSLYSLFVEKCQLPAENTKQTVFLIDMLLNFADSTSTDYDFALEMLVIIMKAAAACITSDQECLNRIANSIEKFKLKKNIPESISVFLSGIGPKNTESSSHEMLVDDESGLRLNRKSSILASFKRQRDAFITDPQDIYEENEYSCVVCSESGNGDNEDNFLGVPIQINESTLMSTATSEKSLFLKGCHHLVHKKCFDSLSAAGPGCSFKKCSLCNCVIDSVIPFLNATENNSFYFVDNFNVNFTLQSLEMIHDPSADLFNINTNLCGTLCYIGKKIESVESIPLHQILTLTQIKRNLMTNASLKGKFNTNLVKRILQNHSTDDLDCVEGLQVIISSFIFYALGKLSAEDFSCIYRKIATDSPCQDAINLALNLFINESLSKTSPIQDFTCTSAIGLEPNFKFNLIDLPYRHDLFLKEYLTKKCINCNTSPRSGAVCLLCGVLVCVGQQCCRATDQREGECCVHRKKCTGSVGMFFLIRSSALLITSDTIGAIVPAPYVTSFGENDIDLNSSSALFLHNQLYYGKLTEMWRNLELRDFILRHTDNSRFAASSWRML